MYNHINIISTSIDEVFNYTKNHNISVYGTSVVNGYDASTLSKSEKERYCLIMGNEGNGIKKEILDRCDKNLYIKMNEKVESLNVGVACSILLYELER
jgi:TrmH family RNA methyltransferase